MCADCEVKVVKPIIATTGPHRGGARPREAGGAVLARLASYRPWNTLVVRNATLIDGVSDADCQCNGAKVTSTPCSL